MRKRVHSSLLAVLIGFAVLMVALGVKDVGDAGFESTAADQQGLQQVQQAQTADPAQDGAADQGSAGFIGYAAANGGAVR